MINWISRGIYRAARTRPFTLLLIVALLVSVNARSHGQPGRER